MSKSRNQAIRAVDRLTITFLVDNNIEWMTRLPPSFTHELIQHVKHPMPNAKDINGVPILDFNDFCCGAHGFSALIETRINADSASHLTLFDTGPDSLSLVRNLKAMQIPVHNVERVITSHWHSDHTGGLVSFLEVFREEVKQNNPENRCTVDVHPDRPIFRGIAPRPPYDTVVCAIPPDPTFEQIEKVGGKLETHAEGHVVAGETIWVSGEIPRITEFESGLLGGMRWIKGDTSSDNEGGKWIQEQHIMDERYALIDVIGKGLVIFSACSHAGIVNVVKDAISKFSRPIYMIIGGLHLAGPELGPRIGPTVQFLSQTLRPAPTFILPMHCSGFQSKIALEAAFGEGCVPAGVGHRIDITGDKDEEHRIFPPTHI